MHLSFAYCTDEDIAIRCVQDFATICPSSQLMGSSTSGLFRAGEQWILRDVQEDFGVQGVHEGQVVILTAPRNLFGGQGQVLAVDGVSGTSLQLRRLGKPTGQGYPPAPAAGLTGVTFRIPTFDPQISIASFEANKWFGIDANFADHAPSYIYDDSVLVQWCVLHVLVRAYAAAIRGDASSYLQIRLAQLTAEFTDLRERTVVQWGAIGQANVATSPFSARVRR